MKHFPEPDLPGSEPSKKRKKELTEILKDLAGLKRYFVSDSMYKQIIIEMKNVGFVRWSDVEAIINKYLNP